MDARAEAARDGTVHRPDEPAVALHGVAPADRGCDLSVDLLLDRGVFRLELRLPSAEAFDDLLLLRLGGGDLFALAVGLGAQLRDAVALFGRDPLGFLRLRLFLPEVLLGVVELVLEASLLLDLSVELSRVLPEVLAPRDHLVGAALGRQQRERAVAAVPRALVERQRCLVEPRLRALDLELDPIDLALDRLDLGRDASDLRLGRLHLPRRFGDLTVERSHPPFEDLPFRSRVLELLDRRELGGRRILDRPRELVAARPRVRRRLAAGDGGRDETEQERDRDEAQKQALGLHGGLIVRNSSPRSNRRA